MIRNPKASKQSLRGIKYQFGVRVLQNITEAYKLYKLIGNTLLSDTIKKEVKLLQDNFEYFRIGE